MKKRGESMKQEELVQLAKQLELCDERELVAKVVISYSNAYKAANVLTGRTSGAGSDGFVGIYKDQLVCFYSNLWGTKPEKEKFRISFEFIKHHEIKKGLFGLNNQFVIKAEADTFKLYFMGKRREIIEKINLSIP